MDRGLFNEWSAALRGIADEMDTVAGIKFDVPTPSSRTVISSSRRPKIQVEESFRQTLFETGGDKVATFRTLKRTFDHGLGPVKIVRQDGSEIIVKDMEEAFDAFSV